MSQMTLFGKPKVVAPPIEDPKDISDKEEVEEIKEVKEIEKDDGWSDPINRKALDQQQEKGAAWTHLELITTSNLKDGTVRRISISDTSEEREGFMGSSYGCGGDADIKNPKSYFDGLMKQKLETQEEPYKDFPNGKEEWEMKDQHYSSSHFYRTIPINNYVVIVGKRLKELLKENGFDFDQWYQGYVAIKEKTADEDYNKKVITFKETTHKESQLLKRAETIKESIRYKLGERKGTMGYGETREYFPDKGLDELYKELKQLANDIQVLDNQIKELMKNSFGRTYYSDCVLYGANEVDKVLR